MQLYLYYLELKNRSLLISLCWFNVILVSYIFKEVLLYIVTAHNIVPNILTSNYFIFTDVLEVFAVYVFLIFFAGNHAIVFSFAYHIFLFLLPGLTSSEKLFIVFLLLSQILLFFLSFVVFHQFLLMLCGEFFFGFKEFHYIKSLTLHYESRISEYLIFYTNTYKTCAFYFQTFLAPILCWKYVKVDLSAYSSFRKILYYFCIFFSTIITPPDIFSQIFVSLGIILCCEIVIYNFSYNKTVYSQ